MYDLIIKNGTVIDGTGVPGIKADIGILNGKISKIGNILENANTIIDATGLVVSPGFIDSHSHADHKVFYFPEQREKLEQGITTSVAGQCGGSAAPVKKDSQSDNVTEFGDPDEIRQTMSGFISALSSRNLGANLVPFVGHGTIRKAVMGLSGAAADAEQVKQMEELLAECFEAGACGLSFGLFYAPGCYASTDEATALAKIAAKYNRPVSAHIRSESNSLVEAVEEFISIIKNSGARGVLSHHKAVRKHNWGKVHKTIELLKNAVDRDRFVLSKGHAAPALYATLALKGFFPTEDMKTLRKSDSYLQGHPSMKCVPGVDMSTGSLGQGISTAVGMALAAKLDNKDTRVYTILGDGEIEEGQVWEAAMFASAKKLDNLVVIVDNNNLQIDGTVEEVNSPYPIPEKFTAFGFNTIEIDGNNLDEIESAFL